jgi:hypothetical protein
MPRTFTMDAVILACQQQVDLENHSVISRPEWQGYISRAYGELWTIVFESGLQYFETSKQLTTDGTNVLLEMANHLSTVSFAYLVDATSGRYSDLRELMPQERASASGMSGSAARYYSLVDDKIYLYPTPPAGQVYEMRFVPQSPDLTLFDGDACIDVVTPDGHDFLIWSVAVRACAKTEADPNLAIREREAARDRFTTSVQLRALSAPRRMIVQSDDFDEGVLW